MNWRTVADTRCQVAERPVWDERDGTLHWVDCLSGELYRQDGEDGTARVIWSSGTTAGAAVPRADGGMAVAAGRSVTLLDEHGTPSGVIDVDEVPDGARFNDAVCDPAGRLLAGTTSGTGEAGRLFGVAADGSVRCLLDGLNQSNGLGWSPDGATFYHIDSAGLGLRAFDYRLGTGELSGERTLLPSPAFNGVPDGLTVDAAGDLWIAVWAGGEILRVDPRGRIVSTWRVPVSHPTCLAFGGAGYRTLYLTSATYAQEEHELERQSAPGGVLAASAPVAGAPATRLRLSAQAVRNAATVLRARAER